VPSGLIQRERQQIGPFRLVGSLGTEGPATLYKGCHVHTGALVTLKVLGTEAARDPVVLRRFERECRAARSLDGPHIVHGVDYGQDGDQLYLAMEFVQGVTLAEHLQTKGRMAEAEVIAFAAQVGRALHVAHEQGLIHRDVKPDNVLLGVDGQARLTGFGLARDLAASARLTVHGVPLGTLNFMAPEQFENAHAVDRRCDVYGLAATVYMALTGEVPFKGVGYLDTVRRKLAEELTPPRQLAPELSRHAEQALLQALRESPALRPATCPEFTKELAGVAEPEVAPARAWSGPERRVGIRHPCRLESWCQPLGLGSEPAWEGQVCDISAGGLRLVLGRRFECGAVLQVKLLQKDDAAPAGLVARVVRIQPQGSSRWALGCQLIPPLDAEELQAML